MPMLMRPSYTPLLYSEIGVYRGIHYFLIFALKYSLWVLVRTTSLSEAVLTSTHNYVLTKNKKSSPKGNDRSPDSKFE